MQVTVFGAGGKVGRLVVRQLLDAGHTVVAFTHHSSSFDADTPVRIVQGDVHDAREVGRAIENSAAVISALGSWGTQSKDIVSSGISNIILGMKAAGVRRVVTLTGADARAEGDGIGLIHGFTHGLGSKVPGLKRILKDSEDHIRLLEMSGLEWTVIRSPIMTEHGNPSRFYLTAKRPKPWATINRHSVAKAMVSLVGDPNYARRAPFIRRT